MDPLDQITQTFGKCSRLFMDSASLIVVSELLVVTGSPAGLNKEREGT